MPDLTKLSDEELQQKISEKQTPNKLANVPTEEIERKIQSMTGTPEVQEEKGVVGKTFEAVSTVPSAAIRSTIMGRGYTEGAVSPEEVPTFQDTALDLYYNRADASSQNAIADEVLNMQSPFGFSMKELGGFVASTAGLGLDIATNPFDMLLMFAGKTPAGGGKTIGGKALATKPGQALVNFMNKPVDEMMRTALKKIPGTKTLKNITKPTDFFRRVRGDLFKAKADAGKQFGNRLETLSNRNPEMRIDVSETINNVRPQLDPKNELYNPRLRQQINSAAKKQGNTILTDMLDEKRTTEITLREAQAIKKTIDRTPSLATKLKKGKFADYDETDIDLIEIKSDIDQAALELFPEFKDVKAEYGEVANKFKLVKSMFTKKSLESNIKKRFGSGEVWEDVSVLLPESTIKEIGGFSKATNILKAVGAVAGTGIAFSLAHQLITKPITKALTGGN